MPFIFSVFLCFVWLVEVGSEKCYDSTNSNCQTTFLGGWMGGWIINSRLVMQKWPSFQYFWSKFEIKFCRGNRWFQVSILSFNFKFQFWVSISIFNFEFQYQVLISSFNFKFQFQVSISSFNFKLQFQVSVSSSSFNSNQIHVQILV